MKSKPKLVVESESFHPLVERTRQELMKHPEDDFHRISPEPGDFLSSAIYREELPRALRVWQSLIEMCEKRGFSVEVVFRQGRFHHWPRWITQIVAFGEPVKIWMEQQRKYGERDYERELWSLSQEEKDKREAVLRARKAPLILCLEFYSNGNQKNWADTSAKRLEDRLEDFVENAGEAAKALKEYRLKQEENEKVKREKEAREALERSRVENLRKNTRAWDYAEKLRKYIAKVERTCESSPVEGLNLLEWVAWANDYANSVDPVTCLKTGRTRKATFADLKEEQEELDNWMGNFRMRT